MEIIGIRTKKTWAGPGSEAFDAEMKIWDAETDEYCYLHYNIWDGEHFTVSKTSYFDYITGETEDEPEIDYIEEYDSLSDALTSAFIDGFILLRSTVNEMADITYGRRESIYNYIISDLNFTEFRPNEDEECNAIFVEFMYKTKSMNTALVRRAKAEWTESGDKQFTMYDENNSQIEFFDDIEAAEKSKWYLLYEQLAERLENAC